MLTALFSKRLWHWTDHFSCMFLAFGMDSTIMCCFMCRFFSSLQHGSILWGDSVSYTSHCTSSIWLSAEHTDSSSGVFELRKESTTSNSLFLLLNIKYHRTAFFLFMVAGSRVYSPNFGIFDMSFASSGSSFCSFRCKLVSLSCRSANVVELA